MSKLLRLLATLLLVVPLRGIAEDQPKCSKGFQPYGGRCVSQRMSDYIACVEASGGNRQEITEEVNELANRQLFGEAKGVGRGVIVKGSGSVALNSNSEKELVKKIQEKWYSDAMDRCAKVLDAPIRKSSGENPASSTEIKLVANLLYQDLVPAANFKVNLEGRPNLQTTTQSGHFELAVLPGDIHEKGVHLYVVSPDGKYAKEIDQLLDPGSITLTTVKLDDLHSPTKTTLSYTEIEKPTIPPLPKGAWRFIVSGDSGDCGDVVMPTIAVNSEQLAPSFYWHLGYLRAIYKVDEDIAFEAGNNGRPLNCSIYLRRAWPNVIEHQIAPFGNVPFYLGIGNHEVIPPKDKEMFASQFSDWLSSPTLVRQRLQDGERDPKVPRTYYHWIMRGVDFIYLDNAQGVFYREELSWFDRVIEKARENEEVLSVVVGMNEPLPDSADAHGMCNASPYGMEGCDSGRHVYDVLLSLQKLKPVYVLAGHSNFYMSGVFDNHPPDLRLPGWIVGTAGATRYPLPTDRPKDAITDVYGYLLATVSENSGTMNFVFQQVDESDVPKWVLSRYQGSLVPWCFAHNSQADASERNAESIVPLCQPSQ